MSEKLVVVFALVRTDKVVVVSKKGRLSKSDMAAMKLSFATWFRKFFPQRASIRMDQPISSVELCEVKVPLTDILDYIADQLVATLAEIGENDDPVVGRFRITARVVEQ